VDAFFAAAGIQGRQGAELTREPPGGHRTPTERRNALEDTLGFAAQEADALANYYASVAKQLRLLAQQVALPEPFSHSPSSADRSVAGLHDEPGEPEPRIDDR
jgi:hypothetical protein